MRVIQEKTPVNTRVNFRLGSTKDTFRVIEKKRGDVWIEIALSHGGVITFPDYSVTGGKYSDGDEDMYTPRNLYLSPQYEYIVVEKHLNSSENEGNMYRRNKHTASIIRPRNFRLRDIQPLTLRPRNMQFTETCVAWYCQHRNIARKSVYDDDRETRGLFLMAWESDHVGVFDVEAANRFYLSERKEKGAHFFFFRIYFDFARERFLHAHPVKPWR